MLHTNNTPTVSIAIWNLNQKNYLSLKEDKIPKSSIVFFLFLHIFITFYSFVIFINKKKPNNNQTPKQTNKNKQTKYNIKNNNKLVWDQPVKDSFWTWDSLPKFAERMVTSSGWTEDSKNYDHLNCDSGINHSSCVT